MRSASGAARRGQAKALLWSWIRMTGFQRVQEVIVAAEIPDPTADAKQCGADAGCIRHHEGAVVPMQC